MRAGGDETHRKAAILPIADGMMDVWKIGCLRILHERQYRFILKTEMKMKETGFWSMAAGLNSKRTPNRIWFPSFSLFEWPISLHPLRF